jgi:hypothetical protein
MVTREHVQSGNTKRFTITRAPKGWEVKEEHNSRLIRHTHYTDWHRVERAMQVFDLQAVAHSTNR